MQSISSLRNGSSNIWTRRPLSAVIWCSQWDKGLWIESTERDKALPWRTLFHCWLLSCWGFIVIPICILKLTNWDESKNQWYPSFERFWSDTSNYNSLDPRIVAHRKLGSAQHFPISIRFVCNNFFTGAPFCLTFFFDFLNHRIGLTQRYIGTFKRALYAEFQRDCFHRFPDRLAYSMNHSYIPLYSWYSLITVNIIGNITFTMQRISHKHPR